MLKAIDRLLPALDGVVTRRPGEWISRCPAHDDKDPSLAIRELPDGMLLIHCFGGCSPQAVLGAVGMEMSDLFDRPDDHVHDRPPRLSYAAAIDIIELECRILSIGVSTLLKEGRPLDPSDKDRLEKACRTILSVLDQTR